MGIEDQPNGSLQADQQEAAGKQAGPAGHAGADEALPPGGPTSTDVVTQPDGPEGSGGGAAPDTAAPAPSPEEPASGTTSDGPHGDPLEAGEGGGRQGRDAERAAEENAETSQVQPSDASGNE